MNDYYCKYCGAPMKNETCEYCGYGEKEVEQKVEKDDYPVHLYIPL